MIRKTVFKNREEWLKYKNESFKLSSSNIGIILGYSEYMTPFQYWDKIKKGEITENTNTIRGNLFENSIAEYFENVSTERVVKNTQKYFVLRRDDLPGYIEVSPDRELFKRERKNRVILEIKDTKRYIDIYKDDELPKEWYCQIQAQMYIGGYDMAVLCVYDGNKTIRYRYFNIDEDFAKDIIKKGWIGQRNIYLVTAYRLLKLWRTSGLNLKKFKKGVVLMQKTLLGILLKDITAY